MNGLFFTIALIVIAVLFAAYRGRKLQKENEQLLEEKKRQRIATTDDLTKIKNHTAYTLHIKEIENKRRRNYGLILFDIDNFKNITDTYGHITGDKMLQMVALMLSDIFAEEQYSLYRIGADEFAVIAENISEKKIIDMLLEVRQYENEQRKLRLSKGYSMINKRERFDAAFQKANEMLYADKTAKKISANDL